MRVEINSHLKTSANSIDELVKQLAENHFGHVPRVGDVFSGGGSIPFEAARIGCDSFGSDLNPVAALLTWASLNLIGGGDELYQVRAIGYDITRSSRESEKCQKELF